MRGYFPGLPCYEHFVALQKSAFVPLVFFLLSHLGTKRGLYYIDSTALVGCDNHRINRHKGFAGLAQRGKTSMGWFFGFKLHLVFNTDNEIVALKLTPGNVHDTTPVPALTRDLTGKLFGDKGYIGQKLAEDLLRRGLTLFTRVRKNMKALPRSLEDKALLNARNMADNCIGHIKEFSSLNLSKHRSVINAFVHIIAAITAYQINPFKPKLNLQSRYQLETTASYSVRSEQNQMSGEMPMRAVVCREWGGPERLTFEEMPDPGPLAPGQVRIAVRAAGINFADTLMIQGRYQVKPEFPFSPGLEVAGRVIETATDVRRVKAGDRVMALLDHCGYAEQAVAIAHQTYSACRTAWISRRPPASPSSTAPRT